MGNLGATYDRGTHTITIPIQMLLDEQSGEIQDINKNLEHLIHEVTHAKDLTLLDKLIQFFVKTEFTGEQQGRAAEIYRKTLNNINHNLARAYKNQFAKFLRERYDYSLKTTKGDHELSIKYMLQIANTDVDFYSDIIDPNGTVEENINRILKYVLNRGQRRVLNDNNEVVNSGLDLSYYYMREMVAYHAETVAELKNPDNKWINDFFRKLK